MSAVVTDVRAPGASAGTRRTAQPVVVVGAGPYGLSAAAHLAQAGVSVQVFGVPMEGWEQHMPAGMLLRSRWRASYIADPDRRLGLDAYHAALGHDVRDPVPLERFVAYGRWYQERAVPGVDARKVVRVSARNGGFRLDLDDGESFGADRVVVAAGIVPFASRPPEFEGLRPDLVSHSAEHSDLARFAGRRVAVIGGGQSAVESAALLMENGAEVELVVRAGDVRWLQEGSGTGSPSRDPRLYAFRRIGIGGPRSSWPVAMPALYRRLPEQVRANLMEGCLLPRAASWLRPRIGDVSITTCVNVRSAAENRRRVRLELDDGRVVDVDHALLATGYRIDVARYDFLDPGLTAAIRTLNGYPVLRPGLESSVPGLHFVGAPAAGTFGPVMRFVAGTWASARALTRGIVGRGVPRGGFSW